MREEALFASDNSTRCRPVRKVQLRQNDLEDLRRNPRPNPPCNVFRHRGELPDGNKSSQSSSLFNLSPSQGVRVGAPLTLSCTSSDFYEFCTWKQHGGDGDTCEFEWKAADSEVKKTSGCSLGLNGRIAFTGDYNSHECAVTIDNASPAVRGIKVQIG